MQGKKFNPDSFYSDILLSILILITTVFGNILYLSFLLFLKEKIGLTYCIFIFGVFLIALSIYLFICKLLKEEETNSKKHQEQINEIKYDLDNGDDIGGNSDNNQPINFTDIKTESLIEPLYCHICKSKVTIRKYGQCSCGFRTIDFYYNKKLWG